MKEYEVIILSKARKKIDKLPMFVKSKILWILKNYLKNLNYAITNLDIKKLKWYENRYRLRVGKYRILFEKYEDKLVILVVDVWSRGDIYKNSRK